MKRINNLFEKIVDIDNLYLAVDNAKKNKGNSEDNYASEGMAVGSSIKK